MAKTESGPAQIGMRIPEFELPDHTGVLHESRTLTGVHGTLVVFLCNHCPFVKHIAYHLAEMTSELAYTGIRTIGINPNDPGANAEDGTDGMARAIAEYKFTFPYLVDATGAVARAFGAVCTPDLYLFGPDQSLYYRGQLDDSRPGNGLHVSGESLRGAVASMLSMQPPPADQKVSLGCSIKWPESQAHQ
ncbi:MAG: putative thiol-disulfide isomerase [Nocardia sp.]|uniref:thioredoxin family protein n=1 Tax=Nocardia sp. TaxID=1821 RepID=UPI00262FBBCE|nr:thioredoxin family protein [Nocardia sp.]MCU1644038.1 putative thiol-disulfide isomerase [Nocardia sp.]